MWAVAAGEDGFILRLAPSHGPGQSPDPVVRASRLIIATGGYDRQIPIPGWDLPGVMAAGGIQGFAKQNDLAPGRRFVIAGTGPFLLPVADTVVRLGGEVAAVLESSRLSGCTPHMRSAARVPEKALEGAGYAWTFLRERIPYRTQTVITEILGDDRVEAVRTARIDCLGEVVAGTERILDDIDAVGLGWGFTPRLERRSPSGRTHGSMSTGRSSPSSTRVSGPRSPGSSSQARSPGSAVPPSRWPRVVWPEPSPPLRSPGGRRRRRAPSGRRSLATGRSPHRCTGLIRCLRGGRAASARTQSSAGARRCRRVRSSVLATGWPPPMPGRRRT